jgi:hypothetical protein
MRKLLLATLLLATAAQADYVVTPKGVVITSGTDSLGALAISGHDTTPSTTPKSTTVYTPQGAYQVITIGTTTTVTQVSKGK